MKDLSIKKLYYSISEVSKITEVEQYVLRYWETEFDELSPQKNRAGNRIYTNKDIQLILKIKTLLRDKKYTIEGAKKVLGTFEPEISIVSQDTKIEQIKNSHSMVENKKEKLNSSKIDLEEVKEVLEFILSKL
jgi:DNA-binding transcriptional MerR regulator